MQKLKTGERVQVVGVPEDRKHFFNRTGTVQKLAGMGYEKDDILVFFDTGGVGYFKENQLRKIG